MRLEERINIFLEDFLASNPINTQETYAIALREFAHFCPKELEQITHKDVDDWRTAMENNCAKNTIHTRISVLRTFFNYHISKGVIRVNPTTSIKFKKRKRRILSKAISKEELFNLKELAKGKIRDRTLIEFLATSGGRVSEAVSALIANIDWNYNSVFIEGCKNLQSRYLYFSTECKERLKQYLATRTDSSPYIFINNRIDDQKKKLSRQGVWKMLKKYSKEAGLPKEITTHSLRHYLCQMLEEKGADIFHRMIAMGHLSPRTTRLYSKRKSKIRR